MSIAPATPIPAAARPETLDDVRLLVAFADDVPAATARCATLLDAFGSLANVVHAAPAQITRFDPALAAFARRIADARALFAALLRARLETQPVPLGEPFTEPQPVLRYLLARHRRTDIECVGAMLLDSRHHLLADVTLATGTIDHAAVHPRELLHTVLEHNAAAAFIHHNHPSQIPTPSPSDWELTKYLRKTLNTIDVQLLDHFVLGGGTGVSMRSENPRVFDDPTTATRFRTEDLP